METHSKPKSPNKFWIRACILFVLWYLLLYGFDWSSLPALSSLSRHLILAPNLDDPSEKDQKPDDPCQGRYIYIRDIPRRFNLDYIDNCRSLNKWEDMCPYFANGGIGQRLRDGCFVTYQFSVEVIFHNIMKRYKCLTNDSSMAAAVYVPYYPGLDLTRYIYEKEEDSRKDEDSLDVYKLLRSQPEWEVMNGKDHFLVAGRTTWAHRQNPFGWTNNVMALPEAQNMTMLTIEASNWDKNDFAIPYPTCFHPSTSGEVEEWQRKMRKQKRRSLFCFMGAPRPSMKESIRNEVISQCTAAAKKNKCRFMECRTDNKHNCSNPMYVMEAFRNSVFCLQPPGDSATRRSIFDSILAGCIPVFFTPKSAYLQYLWHLPKDHASYSVLIPEADVMGEKLSIESVLSHISKERVAAMRENVIKLIPRVTYADPKTRLEKLDDAFEVTVKAVLERVASLRRGEFDTK